ncbi:MAG: alpha/beta fold hydrolase [Bosea sp. (in: a-proteobacteria)]
MTALDALFPGFKAHWIDGPEGKLFARVGGEGPPLLLLHGFPQTHAMWHGIAPALAKTHTVVCLDLRGYGWSAAPRSEGGEAYSKRAMGEDAVAAMAALGFQQFSLAGHDRGARVAYRLALEHPGRVTKLALLDILPTFFVWRQIEAGTFPAAHWGFLAEPHPQPEEEIARDPIPYFEGLMAKWSNSELKPFHPAARAAYRESFTVPERIHACCEDYRAGATIDRAADEADLKAGKRILCPTLILWGEFYLTGKGTDTLSIWQESFAPQAKGQQTKGGHFIAEEDAAGTLAALEAFFA